MNTERGEINLNFIIGGIAVLLVVGIVVVVIASLFNNSIDSETIESSDSSSYVEDVDKNVESGEDSSVINLDNEVSRDIVISTSKGDISIKVYPELMPITVENFVGLVEQKFYDGLTFHRVEDWVVQGGDPLGTGMGGSEKNIKLETNDKLKNVTGAVAMARASDPDSASSQFYILKEDASWLDGSYAVFGMVESGMDVVNSLEIGDTMNSIIVK